MRRWVGRRVRCRPPCRYYVRKVPPGWVYATCSGAKFAGRGVYGEPDYEPSALCIRPLCARDRIILRLGNEITAGRERAVRLLEKTAGDTKARYANILQDYGDFSERPKTAIPEGSHRLPHRTALDAEERNASPRFTRAIIFPQRPPTSPTAAQPHIKQKLFGECAPLRNKGRLKWKCAAGENPTLGANWQGPWAKEN